MRPTNRSILSQLQQLRARSICTMGRSQSGPPHCASEKKVSAAAATPRQRLSWKDSYETQFGIAPIRRVGSCEVTEGRCKFCHHFGTEEGESESNSPEGSSRASSTGLASLLAPQTRKKSPKTQFFKSFRIDTIRRHLRNKHKSKWQEFDRLAPESPARTTFFESLSLSGFLPDEKSIHLVVDEGVVRVIRRYLCNHDSDSTTGSGRPPLQGDEVQDAGTDAPEDQTLSSSDCIEHQEHDFVVVIQDRLQFETAVKSVNDSKCFASVSRLFLTFGEALESMRLGTPPPIKIAKYVRSVVALNLTALARVLAKTWCFSILVDGGNVYEQSYLDVRISLPVCRKICNLHLLAIPLSDQSRSAADYAGIVLDILHHAFGPECLVKLTGVATDGVSTMIGCNAGFGVHIRRAVECAGGGGLITNWCSAHQLNLVINRFLSVLDSAFGFRDCLDTLISVLRALSKNEMAQKCPTYVQTRWISIHKTTAFVSGHYEAIVKLQEEMRLEEPNNTWWLCLFMVKDIADKLKHCFSRLQYRNVTSGDQYQALGNLAQTLKMQYEQDTSADGAPFISLAKVEMHIRNASVYSSVIFDMLPSSEVTLLSGVFRDAISSLIDQVRRIETEVGQVSTWSNLESPMKVVECDSNVFNEAVTRYKKPFIAHFGPTAPRELCLQRSRLIDLYETDSMFHQQVESRSCRGDESKGWDVVARNQQMSLLAAFSIGLASISPGTHTVEGDFSMIKYMKTDRPRLTNYSLEGQLQSKQYTQLIDLVNKVEAADT